MTPLISIIVPIYKVEPYLRKCVDSILAQTYANIEVILVDDGSPDGCPAICDEYVAKDRRVVVIHQENAGVSVARNAGLDTAKGEYIAFVDGDDWIEPDMYEVLYQVIKDSGADIAVSSYCGDGDRPVKADAGECREFSVAEAMRKILNGQWELLCLWDRLFSRRIIEPIRFSSSLRLTEDGLFSIQALVRSNTIACIDYPCYHYVFRGDSASHACGDGFWRRKNAIDGIVDVIKSYDRSFSSSADRCAIEFAVNMVKQAESKGWLSKRPYAEIVTHVRTHLNGGSWCLLSFKSKCWLVLFLLGRRPFICGRKLFRRLLMPKSSWRGRGPNDS